MTSFHHQPEAQHPNSSAIHKIAGRLPHLSRNSGVTKRGAVAGTVCGTGMLIDTGIFRCKGHDLVGLDVLRGWPNERLSTFEGPSRCGFAICSSRFLVSAPFDPRFFRNKTVGVEHGNRVFQFAKEFAGIEAADDLADIHICGVASSDDRSVNPRQLSNRKRSCCGRRWNRLRAGSPKS